MKDFTITTTSGLQKDQKEKNRIAQTIYQQLARFRLAKLTLFRSKMLLININTVKKIEIKGKYRNILWGLWKGVSNSNTISFSLYRACFTHLSSSNLSCNLCLWYYDQLVLFNKEINAKVYRHSLWEYSKRFHCSFEWHLTPHITLSIETCIRRTPCIKGTLQHSPRVSA